MGAPSEPDPVEADETPASPEPTDERAAPDGVDLRGSVDGEPFTVRGVLARRLRPSDPVEIRLLDRPASCATFDADYESRDGEPIVVIYLDWPHVEGDEVTFRASQTHERISFCEGNERGHTRCEPRAPEQGSLTVVEAREDGGALSFDVESDAGTLRGRVAFTICPRT